MVYKGNMTIGFNTDFTRREWQNLLEIMKGQLTRMAHDLKAIIWVWHESLPCCFSFVRWAPRVRSAALKYASLYYTIT